MNLQLISSNIRFDNPTDKEHDWQGRRIILKERLLSYSPDVIATQEGREPQLRDLEQLLNMRLIDDNRVWIPERMYPCLFIDENRFQVLNSGDIWLSETPKEPGSKSFDSAFPRLCTWAHLRCLHTQQEFCMANMHLDHEKVHTRFAQAKVFTNEVPYDFPLIVTGDFNSCPETDVYKHMLETLDLIDPWRVLEKKEMSSHHRFNGDTESGCRIDWMLHSDHFKCSGIDLDTNHVNGIYPSDHFILNATMSTN